MTEGTPGAPLLSVRDLRKHFTLEDSWLGGTLRRVRGRRPRALRAVDGVSFDLHPGETLGVVGESGCGKTTLGRTVLRLLEPTEGTIEFGGVDLGHLSPAQLRPLRRHMQIVFQDPAASLNPRKTVREMLCQALRAAGTGGAQDRVTRMFELLADAGLEPEVNARYPHQLSGGQKQRVSIARALATEPEFIVADEPVSSLDVSVQAQILHLLAALQERRGMSMLFISHDLSVVRQVSHRIAVMYMGRIVELGPADGVVHAPLHPYTRALLAAVPDLRRPHLLSAEALIEGDAPGAPAPGGCAFVPRCPLAQSDACGESVPELTETAPGRRVACHVVAATRR